MDKVSLSADTVCDVVRATFSNEFLFFRATQKLLAVLMGSIYGGQLR